MNHVSLQHIINTTSTTNGAIPRFLLLENYPALMLRDWLPPADEWPELAELRTEHERLLAACDRAIAAATATNARFSTEDDAVKAEIEAALRESREEKKLKTTSSEERRKEREHNQKRLIAAIQLLVEFLEGAFRQLQERAPALYAQLAREAASADEKRAEAQRLLAEAEGVVACVQRKQSWLDRESGRSSMPHYPYEQVPVPRPEEPVDLVTVLAGGAITAVEHA
jgi:hypothetical protein